MIHLSTHNIGLSNIGLNRRWNRLAIQRKYHKIGTHTHTRTETRNKDRIRSRKEKSDIKSLYSDGGRCEGERRRWMMKEDDRDWERWGLKPNK